MDYLHSKDSETLFRVLLRLKTLEEYRKFLGDLLTEAEVKEFSNRWKVAQMLEEKVPYEDITKATGMSSTTIARIQKWKEKGKGGYKLMLKRTMKKQTMKTKNVVAHHNTPGKRV